MKVLSIGFHVMLVSVWCMVSLYTSSARGIQLSNWICSSSTGILPWAQELVGNDLSIIYILE